MANPVAAPVTERKERTLADEMLRYVEGDRAGFDRIYTSISPRLLGYLAGLLADRAAAEDALQQTFIRLHDARDSYVRGADPLPWIFTIAHRVALDELRRRRRARVRVALSDDPLPEVHADLDGSAAGSTDLPDERLDVTLAALAHLPANQRAALLLTKLEGRSVAEAAEIAGTTAGAIKLRAHRAYVTLRRIIAKESR
ncbi:MAG: RNA polymerase sigma factor [Polyangia bacterium]